MFIDIHAHAYRKPVPLIVRFCSPEELIQRYDELGIEKGVLMPVVSPEIYLPQANEDILDMAEQYPDRFIPYCNVDPRSYTNTPNAPLDVVLQYYKDRGCKGLGEVMPNMSLMDPKVQNLFRCAEKVGLPVTYDGAVELTGNFGLYDEPGLPYLEATLQCFPELKIFGHGPVFWSEIARLETLGERGYRSNIKGGRVGVTPNWPIKEEGVVPKLLRRYPNLYGDLADGTAYNALNRDHEYGPKFLTEFQDRLMFGTDITNPNMPVHLTELLISWRDSGKISEAVFQKVARENAIRILELDK